MFTKTIISMTIAALLQVTAPTPKYIGTFECTAYAEDTITATGTAPRHMKTVAVDPTVIPYGTKLYIEDLDIYVTAEDCGGAVKGNVIDIFMDGSEEETASFGRQTHKVYEVR